MRATAGSAMAGGFARNKVRQLVEKAIQSSRSFVNSPGQVPRSELVDLE